MRRKLFFLFRFNKSYCFDWTWIDQANQFSLIFFSSLSLSFENEMQKTKKKFHFGIVFLKNYLKQFDVSFKMKYFNFWVSQSEIYSNYSHSCTQFLSSSISVSVYEKRKKWVVGLFFIFLFCYNPLPHISFLVYPMIKFIDFIV